MFNVEHILQVGGLLAVAAIVFAESGLLIGFLLPGDTLLFTAGIFAGQGKLSIYWALFTIISSAIIGYQVGYKIGEHAGPRFFKRQNGLLFSKDYLEKSEKFFKAHGGKSIILARFVPIVRTLISVMAGVGKMDMKKYLTYNIIGATAWGGTITLIGYWSGSKIHGIENYVAPVMLTAIVLTFSGPIIHLLRRSEVRAALKKKFFSK